MGIPYSKAGTELDSDLSYDEPSTDEAFADTCGSTVSQLRPLHDRSHCEREALAPVGHGVLTPASSAVREERLHRRAGGRAVRVQCSVRAQCIEAVVPPLRIRDGDGATTKQSLRTNKLGKSKQGQDVLQTVNYLAKAAGR